MQQFFPNIEQILDVLFAELPDGVYPVDRADDPDPNKRSNSSAEIRAHAQVYANLYANMQVVNADKFISTVTPDGLARWEIDLFAAVQDGSLGYAVRQANLFSAIRATGSISLPAIQAIVGGLLTPLGLPFLIVPWNGVQTGPNQNAWILELSALGLDTFLSLEDPILGTGLGLGLTPLDCNLDYAAAGLTAQDLANIQATAYTYEVQIYGNAPANVLALLDARLTAKEPARSAHIIRNNATPPPVNTALDMGPFTGDTSTNVIDGGNFTSSTFNDWELGGF